eukprot:gene4765-7327_t
MDATQGASKATLRSLMDTLLASSDASTLLGNFPGDAMGSEHTHDHNEPDVLSETLATLIAEYLQVRKKEGRGSTASLLASIAAYLHALDDAAPAPGDRPTGADRQGVEDLLLQYAEMINAGSSKGDPEVAAVLDGLLRAVAEHERARADGKEPAPAALGSAGRRAASEYLLLLLPPDGAAAAAADASSPLPPAVAAARDILDRTPDHGPADPSQPPESTGDPAAVDELLSELLRLWESGADIPVDPKAAALLELYLTSYLNNYHDVPDALYPEYHYFATGEELLPDGGEIPDAAGAGGGLPPGMQINGAALGSPEMQELLEKFKDGSTAINFEFRDLAGNKIDPSAVSKWMGGTGTDAIQDIVNKLFNKKDGDDEGTASNDDDTDEKHEKKKNKRKAEEEDPEKRRKRKAKRKSWSRFDGVDDDVDEDAEADEADSEDVLETKELYRNKGEVHHGKHSFTISWQVPWLFLSDDMKAAWRSVAGAKFDTKEHPFLRRMFEGHAPDYFDPAKLPAAQQRTLAAARRLAEAAARPLAVSVFRENAVFSGITPETGHLTTDLATYVGSTHELRPSGLGVLSTMAQGGDLGNTRMANVRRVISLDPPPEASHRVVGWTDLGLVLEENVRRTVVADADAFSGDPLLGPALRAVLPSFGADHVLYKGWFTDGLMERQGSAILVSEPSLLSEEPTPDQTQCTWAGGWARGVPHSAGGAAELGFRCTCGSFSGGFARGEYHGEAVLRSRECVLQGTWRGGRLRVGDGARLRCRSGAAGALETVPLRRRVVDLLVNLGTGEPVVFTGTLAPAYQVTKSCPLIAWPFGRTATIPVGRCTVVNPALRLAYNGTCDGGFARGAGVARIGGGAEGLVLAAAFNTTHALKGAARFSVGGAAFDGVLTQPASLAELAKGGPLHALRGTGTLGWSTAAATAPQQQQQQRQQPCVSYYRGEVQGVSAHGKGVLRTGEVRVTGGFVGGAPHGWVQVVNLTEYTATPRVLTVEMRWGVREGWGVWKAGGADQAVLEHVYYRGDAVVERRPAGSSEHDWFAWIEELLHDLPSLFTVDDDEELSVLAIFIASLVFCQLFARHRR